MSPMSLLCGYEALTSCLEQPASLVGVIVTKKYG